MVLLLLSFFQLFCSVEVSTARTICIFEDEAHRRLLPLVYTRPVYELVSGLTSLREKILRHYPGCTYSFQCRGYLAEILRREHTNVPVNQFPEGECLFINGRVLADARLAETIPLDGQETLYLQGDALIAARVNEPRRELDLSVPLGPGSFPDVKHVDVEANIIDYPWDLVERNRRQIERDFTSIVGCGSIAGKLYDHVDVVEECGVYVGEGATIKPGTVLDAEGGPVYVGDGATIHPNVTIEGPAVIGRRVQVRAGARISAGTTVGPVCKIGGEVDQSVVLGYSNKQHDGYLGHSYIGSWVNLGAGSTNSDLKNNYRTVRICVSGDVIDTGSLFVGLIMGDHSKSGINTMFNTGTVVGVCCNIFGADFPPKFVPSFSWGGSEGLTEHDVEKAIETAQAVMARRDRELTPAGEKVLRHVFELTAAEREKTYSSYPSGGRFV